MPTNNLYPRYSFVQEVDAPSGACGSGDKFCLPLSSNANVAFQVTLRNISVLQTGAAYPTDPYLAVVPSDFACSYDTIDYTGGMHPLFRQLQRFAFSNHYEYLTMPSFSVPGTGRFFFDTPDIDFDSLTVVDNTFVPAVGDCFKFAIVWDTVDGVGDVLYRTFFGCTNCFVRIDADDCYISVLSYANNLYNNAFDFDYSYAVNFKNIVELPMYLSVPEMTNDQKVYNRSDGIEVKLYERKEESYMLKTDYMPYYWHKSLDIALSHDTVNIASGKAGAYDPYNTAVKFVKKDNYKVDYLKDIFSSLGKGSVKLVNANPVSLYNNNCS